MPAWAAPRHRLKESWLAARLAQIDRRWNSSFLNRVRKFDSCRGHFLSPPLLDEARARHTSICVGSMR